MADILKAKINGVWTPIPVIQGEKGDTGNGIVSIVKTATVGKVDTYTITYTNGTTSTFTVTNGTDYSVWGNITGNLQNQTDLKNALDSKQPNLPAVVNNRFLHTNSSTGALEWSQVDLSTKQDLITASNKLSADLVDDSNADHKFITSTERAHWEGVYNRVPSQAYDTGNELADKNFVNSSIATHTGYFLGTLDVVTDLGLSYGATAVQVVAVLNSYTWLATLTNNDYCFVINKETQAGTLQFVYQRYKYRASAPVTFLYEYSLNNSSFTADQWAAINSGITSELVPKIHTHLNKALLDTYDQTNANIASAVNQKHVHDNKAVLDTISSNDITNWNNKQTALPTAVNDRFLHTNGATGALEWSVVDLSSKQDKIDSSHKLASDLVDDTNQTNKFVTTAEKSTWNGKSVVSASATGTSTTNIKYLTINGTEYKCNSDLTWGSITGSIDLQTDLMTNLNSKQPVITAQNQLSSDLVTDTNATNRFVTETDITSWNNKADAFICSFTENMVTHEWSCNRTFDTIEEALSGGAYVIGYDADNNILLPNVEYTAIPAVPQAVNGICFSGAVCSGTMPMTHIKLHTFILIASGAVSVSNPIALNNNDLTIESWSSLSTVNKSITGAINELYTNKQNLITTANKVSSDLIDDSTHANKFVTATEKTNWTNVYNKVPAATYDTGNELADKNFVNSSIATHTANFLGTLDAVTDLGLSYGASAIAVVTALNDYTWLATLTNNDYCFVINKEADEGGTLRFVYQRYKYRAIEPVTFLYEYSLNNSSFTAVQWAAINSGITTALVSDINLNTTARHTHSNITVLNGITASDITNWNNKQPALPTVTNDRYLHTNGTTGALEWSQVDLSSKQNVINASNKLSADYINNSATNFVVTSTEKNTWNGKSVVAVASTGTSTNEVEYITIDGTESKLAGGTKIIWRTR